MAQMTWKTADDLAAGNVIVGRIGDIGDGAVVTDVIPPATEGGKLAVVTATRTVNEHRFTDLPVLIEADGRPTWKTYADLTVGAVYYYGGERVTVEDVIAAGPHRDAVMATVDVGVRVDVFKPNLPVLIQVLYCGSADGPGPLTEGGCGETCEGTVRCPDCRRPFCGPPHLAEHVELGVCPELPTAPLTVGYGPEGEPVTYDAMAAALAGLGHTSADDEGGGHGTDA